MLNVKKIHYDETYTAGCETCDYGSSYINEIKILLEDNDYISVEVDKMYDYALSENDIIISIAESNNPEDFIKNIIKTIVYRPYENVEVLVSLEGLNIIFNGKMVDIIKTLNTNKVVYKEE